MVSHTWFVSTCCLTLIYLPYRIKYIRTSYIYIRLKDLAYKVVFYSKTPFVSQKKHSFAYIRIFRFFPKSFRFVHAFFSKNPFVSLKKKPAKAEAEAKQQQRHCYPARALDAATGGIHVLRLERDGWSMVKWLRQAINITPPPAPPTPSPTTPSHDNKNAPQAATRFPHVHL